MSSANKNHEGYQDPTASQAIACATEKTIADIWPSTNTPEAIRFKAFIKAVKCILDAGGYELVSRIEVKDIKTGKVWR